MDVGHEITLSWYSVDKCPKADIWHRYPIVYAMLAIDM